MKLGSLFSGIGGFELAAEWCGHQTIWQSEIDPYCTALLAERFPGVPNLGDITTIDWRNVERPDIIAGGFPCQDISYAGKGAGLAGERSGLWYEFARCIREVGPRYVIVENVRALFTRGFGDVLGTLADLGYDAEWAMYGAADVGAPHRRHRVWVLGYPTSEGLSLGAGEPMCGPAPLQELERPGRGGERSPLAHAASERGCGGDDPREDAEDAHPRGEAKRAGGDREWWAVEPNVCGMVDGLPEGLDRVFHSAEWQAEWEGVPRVTRKAVNRIPRLRGLGNAIVPEAATPCFRRIHELESERAS